jgi:hypothetical protein
MKIFESFYQTILEGLVFNNDKITLDDAIFKIKESLEGNVPYYNVTKGTFGNDSIYLAVSFQSKDEWAHKIFENSPYFRMAIYDSGEMEVFTNTVYKTQNNKEIKTKVKFRKTKVKSIDEVIKKLTNFIDDIKEDIETIDVIPTLDELYDNASNDPRIKTEKGIKDKLITLGLKYGYDYMELLKYNRTK